MVKRILRDAVDGQERTLLEMVGGGVPANRADLRFGRDDRGGIYLLTKQDGVVRRLVPRSRVPTLGTAGWIVLAALFGAMPVLFRRGRAGERSIAERGCGA